MFRALFRMFALLMVAWAIFMAVAAALAMQRKREPVTAPDPEDDEINLVTAFDELKFESHAHAFRGGKVETWFGGGVLDLSDATLAPGGARLEINAVFGGGQLVVPDSWVVDAHVSGVGGVGDGRPKMDRPDDAPHLELAGTALFGGWGVTSAEPATATQAAEPTVTEATGPAPAG